MKENIDLINVKIKKKLPFDFYLIDYNCCIEYDGLQHFQKSKLFNNDYKQVLINDQIKNDFCLKNNIKLIRIPYTEFKNIEQIIKNEYNCGFNRSLDLSKELHNKIKKYYNE